MPRTPYFTRYRLVHVFLLLGVLAVIFVFAPRLRQPAPPPSGTLETRPAYATTIRHVSSPLAGLHAPDTDGLVDVSALQAALTGLAQTLQGNLPPIGDDRDLARAFLGRNRDGLAFLPADSPAYDPATGHLRDRWGTPYFVHPRAARDFEIRSAGPDQKLFTPDDLVASTGPYSPQAGTPRFSMVWH